MKINEDDKTVQGTDVLFPADWRNHLAVAFCEENYDKLMSEVNCRNIPMKDMWWYLDTRKYGNVSSWRFRFGLWASHSVRHRYAEHPWRYLSHVLRKQQNLISHSILKPHSPIRGLFFLCFTSTWNGRCGKTVQWKQLCLRPIYPYIGLRFDAFDTAFWCKTSTNIGYIGRRLLCLTGQNALLREFKGL